MPAIFLKYGGKNFRSGAPLYDTLTASMYDTGYLAFVLKLVILVFSPFIAFWFF